MDSTAYFENEKIVSRGDKVDKCLLIKSGRVLLEWKWETWEPVTLDGGSFICIAEVFFDLPCPYDLTVKSDADIASYSKEEIADLKDGDLKFSMLKSISSMYAEVIQQKFISLRQNPEELMHTAFDTFVHQGDKQRAIDTYTKFISCYPNSPYVDKMLQIIQNIYLDQIVDTNLPLDESEAYENILTRINSSDPQENIILLKDFERKFPESDKIMKILSYIISEYEKLEDEYQLNYYIKKLLFLYPDSMESMDAMFSLITLQRRNGDPEWYENTFRFFLMFPKSRHEDILNKFIGRNP